MPAGLPNPERELWSILAALPMPVAVLDLSRDSTVCFLNPSFVEAYGFTVEDVPTASAWAERAFPDPAYRESIWQAWWADVAQSKRTGCTMPAQEHRIVDKAGQERAVLIGFALHDHFVIITLQDITAARHIEAALEAERRKTLQTAYLLTENMPAGAYTMLKKPGKKMGEFAFLSKKFLEMLDLTRDEAVGDVGKAFSRLHPDDYAYWIHLNTQAFAHKRPFLGEARIIVHGEIRWIRVESVPRDLPDGSTLWEGIMVDITALKETEALLRSVMEATGGFPWKLDLRTMKSKTDTAIEWAAVLPVNSDCFSIDEWFESLYPDDVAPTRKALDALMSGQVPRLIANYRRKTKDGAWVWLRNHVGISATDLTGTPIELSGVSFDITEEVAQRQQVQDAQAKLREDLQRAQQLDTVAQVTGAVAHDLNNLIAVISGTAELLEEQQMGAVAVKAGLKRIQKTSHLASVLVSDLGRFMHPKRERQDHDLRKLLQDGMELLGSQRIARHSVRLEVPDQTVPVWANPTEMAQVIVNLGINACDSGGAARDAQVLISALPAGTLPPAFPPNVGVAPYPGEEVALFRISDTGAGISPDIRERLFQPDFSTKGHAGTGLGLSIVAHILQSNDGALWIESEAGVGTTITVAWPVAEDRAEITGSRTKERSGGVSHRSVAHAVLKGLRVMVVDDLYDVAAVLAGMLKAAGAEVKAESDLEKVQKMLMSDSESWSVLVTDMNMAGMMGDELARFAAKLPKPVPTVLVTARPDLLNDTKRKEFVSVLSKPMKGAELVAAVHDAAAQKVPGPCELN
jgi:signal transduction histidine kinase